MVKGIKYYTYDKDNKYFSKLFDIFYSGVFFMNRKKRIVSALENYCAKKGNGIDDFMSCTFSDELVPQDEENFGASGVVFYFDYPVADEDCAIILTYEEFYNIVKKKYEEYIENNQNLSEVNEIKILLSKLYEVLML